MSFFNRLARGGALFVLLAVMLVGCGDSEPDQRKAFIQFLQDINNRPGVHFLNPTPEEEKAFGPYLRHYALILDFNKDMKATSEEFARHVMRLGLAPTSSPRTIEQMAAAPQDLTVVKDEVAKMEQAMEMRLARATADRAALTQPNDLKAVYDRTFDKLVVAPTLAFEKSVKALQTGIDASIRLVDYINSHRGRLTISGTQIRAADQRTLDELNALFKAHQEAGEHFAAAQRDGDRLVRGD